MASSHSHVSTSGQKTLSAYLVGFVLCIALTLASFILVEKQMLSTGFLYISLFALAMLQLFVQSVCFLRLNGSAEGRWNLLPYIFTFFIIAIFVGGTIWIMYNLDYYMYN